MPRPRTIGARASLAALTTLAAAATATAQPQFTGIGDLSGGPAPSSSAWALSADGSVVVGSAWDGQRYRAVRWTWSGGMESLGDLPGGPFDSFALGVSPDGATIVGSTLSPLGREAFRWNAGEGMVGLGDLPGGAHRSYAWDTTDGAARIVGQGDYEFDPVLVGRAARWDGGGPPIQMADTYSEAFAVTPDGAVVVGVVPTPAGLEAFRWTEGGGLEPLGDLPGGGVDSAAKGTNGDGSVIVGSGTNADGLLEPVQWTDGGGMESLGNLPGAVAGTGGAAWACSADGSIVVGFANYTGFCGGSADRAEAFIWTREKGMRRVRDVLMLDYGLDVSGWALEVVLDISDDGSVICGAGINPEGEYEGWVARLGDGPCRADFNQDGALDFFDFLEFQTEFGRGCE
jgi:uncharacterized membrane protein